MEISIITVALAGIGIGSVLLVLIVLAMQQKRREKAEQLSLEAERQAIEQHAALQRSASIGGAAQSPFSSAAPGESRADTAPGREKTEGPLSKMPSTGRIAMPPVPSAMVREQREDAEWHAREEEARRMIGPSPEGHPREMARSNLPWQAEPPNLAAQQAVTVPAAMALNTSWDKTAPVASAMPTEESPLAEEDV
jgi:type II secretory pathway pseudopilin PulG